MGIPGLLPGGITVDGTVSTSAASSGVFAQNPGATPKYALNRGQRDAEHRETMARLFIQMSQAERSQFVRSVPPESQNLARLLCGAGSGASGGTGFMDFLLTQASEPFQEKVQVVETLSDNFVVYLFGQSAPQFQYSGVLLNTYQDDQRVWMMRLYRDILRGTQLARRRKLVRLRYDSVIVSGIFIAHQQALEGSQENSAQFSFTMIPMQYVIFSPAVGAPTQLETAFTPGSRFGLNTVMPPSMEQLRARSPSRPPLPSQKMATDKEPDLFAKDTPDAPSGMGTDETPQGQLAKRVQANTPSTAKTQTSSDIYGGVPPGQPLPKSS